MRDVIHDLQLWYAKHCDGDWEHQHGIKIETLDNPGWAVEINLIGTILSDVLLPEKMVERSSDDWIRYSAEQGVFKGFGGPKNLLEILSTFFEWADQQR